MSNNYQYTLPPLSHSYPVPPSYLPPTIVSNALPTLPEQAWTEHVAQDGRVYFYNIITKQSVWEKPDELKTPAEKILSECPWKEFKSDQGKVYYYNSVTQQSVWNKPQELIDAENLAYGTAESVNNEITENAENIEKPKESSAIDEAIKATLASIQPVSDNLNSSKDSSSEDESNLAHNIPIPDKIVYRTKEEMEEGWKCILKELNVPGNATWETAVKMISGDPRYQELKKYNQKKQIFNTYKTQRQKDEREEARLRIKKAKEDLEKFLLTHSKLSSGIGYRKADSLLSDCPEWIAVPERDRREIYEDTLIQMLKREKEELKVVRKRNIKSFNEILDVMPNLTFKTTWYEAQRILLENPRFVQDEDLQSMDKEDALICFEEHIRLLEKEHEEEKEREKRRLRRLQRKNREAFSVFLDELHEKGKLTSLSLWKDLYDILNRDERFYKMLSQPGSTPLDLFKFYVLELKSRFSREKRVVKEILEQHRFQVEFDTELNAFLAVVEQDEQGRALDPGNIRMAYTSLVEKAEAQEKSRRKEAARQHKKAEAAFKQLLRDEDIRASTSWEALCERLQTTDEFRAVELESDRMRYYKEYLMTAAAVSPVAVATVNTSSSVKMSSAATGNTNSSVSGAVLGKRSRSHTPVSASEQSAPPRRKRKNRSSSTGQVDGADGGHAGGAELDGGRKSRDKPKRKKKKRSRADSSMDERNNGMAGADEGKYRSSKKLKKAKKSKKRKHRGSSSASSGFGPIEDGKKSSAVLAPTRQPSEGEVMDEDEQDHNQSQRDIQDDGQTVKHNQSGDVISMETGTVTGCASGKVVGSSGEMSENELEAEKNKLLAELQN